MYKSQSILRSVSLALSGLMLVSVLMVSCLKNNQSSTPTDTAGLMVFNLAPDKQSVGVAIGGNVLNSTPLSFTNYTGGYLAIYPGTRNVSSFEFYSGASLADTSGTFTKDQYYSVFVAGNAGSYRNIITWDNFDSLSANGSAFIRFINAIPDSTKPTVQVTANGNSVIDTQAGFGHVSDFIAAVPGNVTIDINNGAGIDADRTITVEANKLYTVLLTGVVNSGSTPVSIKYITNGTLQDKEGARTAGRAQ